MDILDNFVSNSFSFKSMRLKKFNRKHTFLPVVETGVIGVVTVVFGAVKLPFNERLRDSGPLCA